KSSPAKGKGRPRKATEDQLSKIAVMLLQGIPAAETEANAARLLGMTQAMAAAGVGEAQRRIAQAATVDHKQELATALSRLDHLYRKALNDGEVSVALSAQRERGRLLRLDREVEDAGDGGEDAGESSGELEKIAGHLLPLELAPEDYPLAEHARIAAGIVRKAAA
ncbi:MAG: hypothetical protein AAGI68_16170, partial [Planctomycetota bacterium]